VSIGHNYSLKNITTLLNAGADPNIRYSNGWTILHEACQQANVHFLRLLLDAKYKIDVNIRSEKIRALPFESVIENDSLVCAHLLLENKTLDVNALTSDHMSLLQKACYAKSFGIFELLLKQDGILVNQVSKKNSTTPLHAAATVRSIDYLEALLPKMPLLEARDDEGRTPLFAALRSDRYDHARLLIANEANVFTSDEYGGTLLHITKERENMEFLAFLEYLLKEKRMQTRVNVCDEDLYTPLHCAALKGNKRTTRLLIQYGANPWACTKRNQTVEDLYTGMDWCRYDYSDNEDDEEKLEREEENKLSMEDIIIDGKESYSISGLLVLLHTVERDATKLAKWPLKHVDMNLFRLIKSYIF
jgi:ankyrin repeat protein